MSVDQKHPHYTNALPDWDSLLDAYTGERRVKSKTTTYLPATSAMIADGMNTNQAGYNMYQAYLTRAIFPEFFTQAVHTNMGLLWQKNPLIELPPRLESMMERATLRGENLFQLLRRIHEQLLVTGRAGLLVDIASEDNQPYLSLYGAKSIINWDDGSINNPRLQTMNLVVLDESEYVRENEFEWEWVEKYRVLQLGALGPNEPDGAYTVRLINREEDTEVAVTPMFRGEVLNKIPFVFANAKDLLPDPDVPPLLGLAQLCYAIYRGEADYRQNLFMQGQDTLVVIGAAEDEETYRVGAHAVLVLPQGSDAKYVGVDGKGLPEQRLSLENDRRQASSRSGQLVDTTSRQRESGDALNIRVGAQTATLGDVARAGAGSLESALRIAAEWIGEDPQAVSVQPNMEFMAAEMTARSIVELATAKGLGAPISLKTIHELMAGRRLTELTYEEELAAIRNEVPLVQEPQVDRFSGSQGSTGRGTAGV